MRLVLVLVLCLLLGGGCVKQRPIIRDRVVETKVPVSAPCVADRPEKVAALRDQIDSTTWSAMGTDQREKRLTAQAMDRKTYGDKLDVATAGCN